MTKVLNINYVAGFTSWSSNTTNSNFQSRASRTGRQFEQHCEGIIASQGWNLMGKKKVNGVEIDQVIERNGIEIWVEFKGVHGQPYSNRPGCVRTDTMKKAIANGALIRRERMRNEFWVVTSHMPKSGAALTMADRAITEGFVSQFVLAHDLTYALHRIEFLRGGIYPYGSYI